MNNLHFITIVKIGGNIVDDPAALDLFLRQVRCIHRSNQAVVIVHGGGKEATRLCKRLDIPVTMIDGRRVTDAATLDVATMVYAGLVNKRIVAKLRGLGVDNVLGLTGADCGLVPSYRRLPEPVDYGFVGDIDPEDIPAGKLLDMLKAGVLPVFCAITCTEEGQLLNSNADNVASAIAKALAAQPGCPDVRLIYCLEQPGVMRDINDPRSLISVIRPGDFDGLCASGTIHSGMIPKVAGAIDAVSAGVTSVRITNPEGFGCGAGTVVCL